MLHSKTSTALLQQYWIDKRLQLVKTPHRIIRISRCLRSSYMISICFCFCFTLCSVEYMYVQLLHIQKSLPSVGTMIIVRQTYTIHNKFVSYTRSANSMQFNFPSVAVLFYSQFIEKIKYKLESDNFWIWKLAIKNQ